MPDLKLKIWLKYAKFTEKIQIRVIMCGLQSPNFVVWRNMIAGAGKTQKMDRYWLIYTRIVEFSQKCSLTKCCIAKFGFLIKNSK